MSLILVNGIGVLIVIEDVVEDVVRLELHVELGVGDYDNVILVIYVV